MNHESQGKATPFNQMTLKQKKDHALFCLHAVVPESVADDVKLHVDNYCRKVEEERDKAVELLKLCFYKDVPTYHGLLSATKEALDFLNSLNAAGSDTGNK